ncbi:MAG: DEAD/DEAH box helicase family protein, partial [Bacteroidia bacterium]|nr:DEAD/DEAH box helicase family protein [Bacteroidia bacterium]
MSYKVVYCAVIDDDKHSGLIKIGDTDFVPNHAVTSYTANAPDLRNAAEERIREWSGTAAAGAQLIYCELLLRYNQVSCNYETFRDHEIHSLVQSVGGYRIDFDSSLDSGKEWFKTDLETVVAAIKAKKEGRDYLDTSELPEQTIYNLREEQQEAVERTQKRFEKASDMLWHAKMRFGKTITALTLVKREQYKRTIIITHRPVVEDGWGSDFYHVFSKNDAYAFLTKIHDGISSFNDDETDAAIDAANEARLQRLVDEGKNIVYFASIQDLRGSKMVGGKFDKNRIVFEIPWDLVIIDEAHEGTKTQLGQSVIEHLIKENTKKLDLSGTAYNLLDKYTDGKSVFTWDYVMEQEKKHTWAEKHPGEPNPYADMPVMHINTYDLQKALKDRNMNLSGRAFTFREFFRTWTGDLSKDGADIPEGSSVGDFVHADDVLHFLDLLSQEDAKSRFPYASEEGCKQNIHTLWMIPGVKEAAALSRMLKKHPFFSVFGIANVAGEGDHDEEKNYSNALEFVRKTIESNPCTITLSCGRLTTGVTVKEWSSVFMLSGSEETDAKQYMQTIFRVQSAGKINGEQKTDCYVYDFAPDRALTVIAETAGSKKSKRSGTFVGGDGEHAAFRDFLKYCPVVAIDGAEFKPFNVQDLVSQINR